MLATAADYPWIKQLHLTAVALSLSGFLLRFAWRLYAHPYGSKRLTRLLPHINDTVLLLSGLAMGYLGQLNPLTTPWLAAKLFWLVVYIIAGSYALKRCPTRRCQWRAFGVAVVAALLILGSAISHSAWSWLALFSSTACC